MAATNVSRVQRAEVRQVFNIAQVYEMKDKVSLLTFDADDTIYEHGMDLDSSSWIVNALCALMECGSFPPRILPQCACHLSPSLYLKNRCIFLMSGTCCTALARATVSSKQAPKHYPPFHAIDFSANFLFRTVSTHVNTWHASYLKEVSVLGTACFANVCFILAVASVLCPAPSCAQMGLCRYCHHKDDHGHDAVLTCTARHNGGL
jgi:hypothetical protein